MSTKTLPDLRSFPERLFWLRSEMGLTQEEFGQYCGVTKGYISRLESGERDNPSDVFLRNCCNAFKLSLEWLEKGDGQLPMVDKATVDGLKLPVESRERSIPIDLQQDLTGFMRVLLEVVPMEGDTLLRLTAQVWESPELSGEFKHKLVLAANIAFGEKEQRKRVEPGGGPKARPTT